MNQRLAPRRLVLADRRGEKTVQQQIFRRGFLVVSLFDLAQKLAANDASAAPHQRDAAKVQIPAMLLGGGLQQHITLRVRDDLGAVKRPPHILNKGSSVADRGLGRRPLQNLRRCDALFLQRRQTAREDRLANQSQWLAQIERADRRPLARALLAGRVQYLIHNRRAVFVLLGKDVPGNLDQVTVQFALVPLRENIVQLIGSQAKPALQQVVGLANQLHIAILDAVVNHLDVVAGAVLAHPVAARGSVLYFGGDGLKNRFHVRPRSRIAARHNRRTAARSLFAAGNSGADEQNAFWRQAFGPSVGIGKQR